MAYQRAEALLYRRRDVDLSAYRLRLRQVWHVAVLGLPPPHDVDRQLQRILSAGEAVRLPEDILRRLAERRRQATRLGPWFEAHHRPGRRL